MKRRALGTMDCGRRAGRRTLSLLLACVMMIGLAAPAFGITFAVVTVKETPKAFSSGVLTDGDGTYEVRVAYGEDARIPEGASLVTREVFDGSYLSAAEESLPEGQKTVYSRFFDITILDAEGNPVQPAAPVDVAIETFDRGEIPENAELNVFHYSEENGAAAGSEPADDEPDEMIPVEEEPLFLRGSVLPAAVDPFAYEADEFQGIEEGNAREKLSDLPAAKPVEAAEDSYGSVEFTADGFSVYGVIYCVDFHWEADGQVYEYSLTGGDSVSLRELLAGFLAADGSYDDDPEAGADGLIEEIADVRFSDESLVRAVPVTFGVTAGELKAEYGLECEASAEVTEERRREMDAKEFSAPDWALISLKPFESVEYLTAELRDGGSFSIRVTDAQISTNVMTADGKTYRITVIYDENAGIPEGTKLTAAEIDPESDAYIQRLGQAWYEVNREHFEVEAMRENYSEGMGELPETHLVNLDAARFFDISLVYNGEEIEPKAPVRVEISYDEGLKTLGDSEPVCGVAHFGEEGIELIGDVAAETGRDGGIVSFRYEQSSFSDTGTFVGQETCDARTPQPMAEAPVYDPAKAVTLSSAGVKGLTGTGEGGNSALPSPASSKTLTPNLTSDGKKDGTYTLKLSVAGSSRSTNTAEVTRSNVLIVMDRSSSMVNNKVKIYTEYNGRPKSSVTYYGKEGDSYFQLFTNNGKYYKTKIQNGYLSYFTDEYTGQVYTATEGDRRLDAEQAALSTLISQLLAKNSAFKQDKEGYLLDDSGERVLDRDGEPIRVNDIIELSVISFADRALGNYPRTDGVGNAPNYGTEVGWSTDFHTLMAGVNKDTAPSGTNWEDALRYAKYVADTKHAAQPDEPMFILFLTDGEPTACAGETGGAKHYNNVGGGFIVAYEPARDDARALVTAGYEFYGIFTYGEGEEQVGYLRRLVNVAYGHADNTAQTDDLTEHFHDAGDNDALMSAFQHILSKVSGTISVGNVTVSDGLTTDATATTLVSGKADGFRYSVTGPLGELYSVTASGSDADPAVTFTVNGQNIPGEKKTEHVTRNQVDENGSPIPDPANPGKYLTVTEDKTCYSAAVGTTEYKMALADIENNGQITWDLSAVGTLMEGYSYNCSFVVWPEQEAYDYVAGLNNGLDDYTWDQSKAAAVLDENNNVVYYTGGVKRYPSIVKYPNGTFSVLTNTNQSVTYSIVDTRTDENGGTETTYDGPYTKPLEYPDPMDLTGSGLSVTKYWDDSMDPQQLKDLVEDYAAQHEGAVYSVTLTMYENGVKYKDHTFSPVWDAARERYTWASRDFSIAPALLVSRHPGGGKTYKTVTIGGVTYYVLNDGHEYTLGEESVDYHFEFSADSYHPALVDGELYNVSFAVDGGGHIVNGSAAALRGSRLETFAGTNTLKGRLYVEKKTVIPADTVGVDPAAATFGVRITLTDRHGSPVSSPKGENGDYDAESGLMYRIHYGPYHPHGGDYDPSFGNFGRSGKYAVENGVIEETIYSGDVIYVGNMPVGTHYEVEETDMPGGWKQVGIAAKDENGEADPDQIISGNKADYVTITNTVPSFDVNILKTEAGSCRPLGGARFKLFGADYYVTDKNGKTVLNETPTLIADDLVSDMSTGLIALGKLGGGEYYLVETLPPDGYLALTEPVRIVVDGTSTRTKTFDDEPKTRPLYVGYTQADNILSGSGDGVAIDAEALTDENGDPITDEAGNAVYNYSFTLTVTNSSGYELPSTGGEGTAAFLIAGTTLALTSGAILTHRKRKEN